MADEREEKLKLLKETISLIEKTHGKGAIMRLGDQPAQTYDVISTGSISLDYALGIGGVPRGRIIEIFGPGVLRKNYYLFTHNCRSTKEWWNCGFD